MATKGSSMKQRLRPEVRRDQILAAALVLVQAEGFSHITRDGIAAKAECSTGLVSRYFKTMPQLKRAVMRAAIKAKNAAVVAQGLGVRDPHAMKAPEDLKKQALALLAA